jgi:hypothetical protein
MLCNCPRPQTITRLPVSNWVLGMAAVYAGLLGGGHTQTRMLGWSLPRCLVDGPLPSSQSDMGLEPVQQYVISPIPRTYLAPQQPVDRHLDQEHLAYGVHLLLPVPVKVPRTFPSSLPAVKGGRAPRFLPGGQEASPRDSGRLVSALRQSLPLAAT